LQNVTELDLQLAGLFYPVLVGLAREEQTITYSGLKDRTKAEFPRDADAIDRCTDQAVGRRLEVVRMFTTDRGYPDLTSLVLNKQTGEVGDGFVGDAKSQRQLVWAFDWGTAQPEFKLFVTDLKTSDAEQSPLSEKKAKELMLAASRGQRFRRPTNAELDEIMERIRERNNPADVLVEILGTPARNEAAAASTESMCAPDATMDARS
jgi:hypothetical protein